MLPIASAVAASSTGGSAADGGWVESMDGWPPPRPSLSTVCVMRMEARERESIDQSTQGLAVKSGLGAVTLPSG